jgi:microcystin-dependent protein
MSLNQDFRFNPLTSALNPQSIVAETQTVALLAGLSPINIYGVELDEVPYKETPSTVTVTDLTTSTVLTEATTTPSINEFYVDYTNNSGLVIVDASRLGNTLTINYKGLGTGNSVKHKRYFEDGSILIPSITFENLKTGGWYRNGTVVGYAGNHELLPAGSIIASGTAAAPTGFILCNGSAINRTTFANLFAAIGVTYGAGNGTTTFNIPDGLGTFLRGAGTSTGYTTNVTVNLGSKSDDHVQSHNHYLDSGLAAFGYQNGNGVNHGFGAGGTPGFTVNGSQIFTGVMNVTSVVNGRSTNETTPKYIGVNYFIRY